MMSRFCSMCLTVVVGQMFVGLAVVVGTVGVTCMSRICSNLIGCTL